MKNVGKFALVPVLALIILLCSSANGSGPYDTDSDCASCVKMIKVNITLNSGKVYSGYVSSYAQELCKDCIDSYLPGNGQAIAQELWPEHLSYYKRIFAQEGKDGEREFVSKKRYYKEFDRSEIKEIKLVHGAGNSYSCVQIEK